jgi:hypothetical protein
LAAFNFKISQLCPGAGEHKLYTCGNPDCVSFGAALTEGADRGAEGLGRPPELTPEQLDVFENHGPGANKLSGADKEHRRVSRVFDYQDEPHAWIDQRTIRCKGLLQGDTICNSGFSILSQDHLDGEISRRRNHNGVLDGPTCGSCGTRFLACPDKLTMKGTHQRATDSKAKPISSTGAPKAVRVLHRPCKGKKGARITISLPHEKQKTTKDNLRILNALLNSAGILDVQWMLGTAPTGRKIGMGRIYYQGRAFRAAEMDATNGPDRPHDRAGGDPPGDPVAHLRRGDPPGPLHLAGDDLQQEGHQAGDRGEGEEISWRSAPVPQ